MTNKEKILQFLKDHPNDYCDDCLSELVNAYPRQQVNQICNQLHKGGFIYRSKSSCFKCSRYKFVNSCIGAQETEEVEIPPIVLEWSRWVSWDDLKADARLGGIKVPNKRPGVYEARYSDAEERLTIGKASDLRMRIKQGLVKGKTAHSAGERIRGKEDVSKIVVRWAMTDRPAAVEEELHKRHLSKFGTLPKYVEHT